MKITIVVFASLVAVCSGYFLMRPNPKRLQDRTRARNVAMNAWTGVRRYFLLLFKTHEEVEA